MLDREGFRPNVGIILLNHEEPGVLGQTDPNPLLAVPARGHQLRRDARAGDVPRAPRRSGAALRTMCASSRARATGCATRCPTHFIRRDARGHYQRPEADLVPAAADRPRQRHEPARDRPPGVRRLALERVLGPARRGDRVQARRLPDGADRARALPAARHQHNRYLRSGMRPHHRDDATDHYRRSDALPAASPARASLATTPIEGTPTHPRR